MTAEDFDDVARRFIETLDEEQILDFLTIVAYLVQSALVDQS